VKPFTSAFIVIVVNVLRRVFEKIEDFTVKSMFLGTKLPVGGLFYQVVA